MLTPPILSDLLFYVFNRPFRLQLIYLEPFTSYDFPSRIKSSASLTKVCQTIAYHHVIVSDIMLFTADERS